MYIVTTAWFHVVLMVSLTEQPRVVGIGIFIFCGVALLSFLLWIVSTPVRRRRRKAREAAQGRTGATVTSSSGTGDDAT